MAAAIGTATAYVLEQQKRREEEEALARLEAERANTEARAIEKGYGSYEDMVEAKAKAAFDANWNALLAVTQTTAEIQPGIASVRHLKEREKPVQTPPPPSKSKEISPGLIKESQGIGQLPITPTLATLTPTLIPTSTQTPTQTVNAVEPPLTTEHSDYPGTLPYAGSEVKRFCEKLESEKSGWWYSLGDFTFVDCNGLLLTHESAGTNVDKNRSNDIYAQLNTIVVAQQLYVGGWVDPYCPSGSFCFNGPYNFWAAYSQSARRLIDLYVRGDKPILDYNGYDSSKPPDNPVDYMLSVRALGNAMLYPESLEPDRWNALSQCGNDTEGTIIDYLLKLPLVDPSYANLKPDTFYPGGYGNTGLYYFTKDGNGIWSSVFFWKYHLAELGYTAPTPPP